VDPRFDADVASKLQSFVEQSTDFIGVADPWGRILYLNPAACKALGVADYSDLTLADLFPTEVFSYYYEVVRPELLRTGAWSGEVRVNAADRGAVPMYISTTAQLGPGGETQGGVVLAHDLPGGVPFAAGTIDDVSGVLDRTAFRDQLGLALDASTRRGELCALVLAMIDMAPTIERFGALTATNVLRALAGRITRLTRTIDIVGRVGEHELGLVVRGIRTHNEALRIAGSVYDALIEAPVTTPSGQVSPAIACGLALAQVGDFADDIVERAAAPIFPDGADAARRFRAPAEPVEEPAPLATMDEFVVALEAEADAAGFRLDARKLLALVGSSPEPRPQMVRAIDAIRARGLRTGALTNNWVSEDRTAPAPGREIVFDVVVESSVERLRKPDPRIYALTLARLDVLASQAIFLDDLGINLKPARDMGITTIKVLDPDDALRELAELLQLEWD